MVYMPLMTNQPLVLAGPPRFPWTEGESRAALQDDTKKRGA